MTYLHNSLFTLLLFALANGQCTENTARCTGSNTYQLCTGGVYGINQTCQSGLVCSSTGSNAFCVRPSEVTTGVPASPPTPCSPENRARCTGTNTYQVCTGGSYGINQTCQSGLVCSSTSDNAFCVRPSEATTGVSASSTTGAIATTGAPASSTTGATCTENTARCTGTNTYQVCTGGVFGANQTCQSGLVCSSTSDNAFCVRPSEVTTGVPAAGSTTGVAASTTTGAASSGSSSGSLPGTACSSNGSQKCLSNNTYTTCTNGFYSDSQNCTSGLSCSPSGNNIYCIRIVSPGQPCSNNGDQSCLTSETYSTCTNNVGSNAQSCTVGTTCHPSGNNIYCY